MIEITPLDVRRKRGDFRKAMRGYETQEVDAFLDLVAERLEEVVKETIVLRERTMLLQAQVDAQGGREKAVQDALVSAQSLRDQINEQSRREAELARREAEVEAGRIVADAERAVEERRGALEELERKRTRFLKAMRRLLERELDSISVEEGRTPLEDTPMDLELSGGQRRADLAPRTRPAHDGEPARSAEPDEDELWLGIEDGPAAETADEELAG
jgi:cell division initiation protein